MERLTQRLRTGEVLMASEYEEKYTEQEWISVLQDRLADYEDTGLTPGEVKSMQEEHFSGLEMAKLHSALMELKKYQEADKDGRLVVLPCLPCLTAKSVCENAKLNTQFWTVG